MTRWTVLAITLLAATVVAESPKDHHDDGATSHRRFDDVERWTKVFDDPERTAWQKPAELIAALGLERGDVAADIGAGTGYFEGHLARAVGADGSIYAVEVEPSLVTHLRERAETEKLANVIPVLGSYDNPRLPAGAVDVILIVDTYHHIDARRDYFRRLRSALSSGGRVVVVDFYKRKLPVGPPIDHKLDRAQVKDEMVKAGYRLAADHDELLPHQYVLVFEPL